MGETHVQEQLMTFMESQVETLQPPTSFPFIYKVPKELKIGHADIFEPKWISIGPLHYDEERPSQKIKKWYMKNFIQRLCQNRTPHDTKLQLAQEMSNLETLKIHEYYRDMDQNLVGFKFAQMMLLDGCFIMELLLTAREVEESSIDKFLGNSEKVPLSTLKLDLLKIENQLPFYVLEILASLLYVKTKSPRQDLIPLALDFFFKKIQVPENFIYTDQSRHLLELVRNALFHKNNAEISSSSSSSSGRQSLSGSVIQVKSASELELYGVKFKGRDTNNMTEIEFANGELHIPRLEIRESTTTEFWNYLISEMFSSDSEIFMSYVVLMDNLINNAKDVEVLVRSHVLVPRNNDINSLISLFNDLAAIVTLKESYFEPLIRDVDKYCGIGCRPLRAYLVRNYYDARWDVLNNVLIFIFTVTQTLFTVLGYNPKKV